MINIMKIIASAPIKLDEAVEISIFGTNCSVLVSRTDDGVRVTYLVNGEEKDDCLFGVEDDEIDNNVDDNDGDDDHDEPFLGPVIEARATIRPGIVHVQYRQTGCLSYKVRDVGLTPELTLAMETALASGPKVTSMAGTGTSYVPLVVAVTPQPVKADGNSIETYLETYHLFIGSGPNGVLVATI